MTQTVFITGASTGIGRATARFFHDKGWNVVATMRSPDKDTELAARDNVLVTRLDVTDGASIHAAVKEAQDRFGEIDALINNAGYGAAGPLETFPMEKVRRQFDTNVLGLIETTQAVLPGMRAKGAGVIVNISSIGGRVTLPLFSLYHGTKWAVEGISESLLYELEPLGIKVKIVEPGAIATDFATRSLDLAVDPSVQEYMPIVTGLQSGFERAGGDAAPAVQVAETIWEAVTDGTDRLRYLSGDDAKEMQIQRTELGVHGYKAQTRKRFSLDGG